ncbi:MAG TPA: tetratricopeptide repeat protein [Phycisphaerales bacterium]|nr:tetratricopeptide repeat protein [Phycisphaerales bacterium]
MNLHRTLALLTAAGLALAGGCAADGERRTAHSDGERPSLYAGFGGYARPVSTDSPEAQRWFDQGIQLLYGFNHDEAIRSFQQAAEIDPDCAMAWWGVAYARGLHINNPRMGEEQSRLAYEAAQEAMERVGSASPVEQALIRAVSRRYAMPVPEDRRHLDEAYAVAMEEAYRAHPDDTDVCALYAESLMNLQPWDLWTHDGQPKGRTPEIVEVLERAMALDSNHPGANHFYIHAVEASPTPERALPAAERLGSLVPGSGHLVHMPSHIFIRTGRYADAAVSNSRAIEADESYFAVAPAPDFYSIYFLHNLHFLAYASMMEGNYEAAIAAARQIERDIPREFLREHVKLADGFMPTALHVFVRFGKWRDILREPEPDDYRLLSRAEWHYARAVALANLQRIEDARREVERFDGVVAVMDDGWFMHNNPASSVTDIARNMALGEIAYKSGDPETAFSLLREAVSMEDNLVYDEPPGWMQPVRHALGALLLAEGRHAEAEEVYRADLEKHPNNGWALLGLDQALRMEGRLADAEEIAPTLSSAWARADVKPVASCYCHPDAQ